ncbi:MULTISPECIES: putative bifunctional diguanylate cyclase/phosphodiesterase [Pacificimonas]|nr:MULTISPECIES: GGDEF and EAL domain-containing protein [Pacificimonas]MBZ6377566.1 EAL domain-containing protein [Pacificimonas aurantium]
MAVSAQKLVKRAEILSYLQRRGIESCQRSVTMATAGNLIFAGLLLLTFADLNSSAALLSPLSVILIGVALRFLATASSLPKQHDLKGRLAIKRRTRLLELANAGLGAAWLCVMLLLGQGASHSELMLIGFTAAGVMGVEAISLSALPRAAAISVGCIAAGGMAAMATAGEIGGVALMIALMLMLMRGIVQRYHTFRNSHLRTRALRRSRDVISLLLRETDWARTDWLWELDAGGRLVDPGYRFAEAAGRSIGWLRGLTLDALFDEGPERTQLVHYLEAKLSFRNVAVRVTRDGETRWWSLSGRPVENGDRVAFRGFATDITEMREAEAKVAYMAHFDALTGLANRATFNQDFSRSLERRRGQQQVALLFLDLDRFKAINDLYGHDVGDSVLAEAGVRLKTVLDEALTVARFGGDEFAVLLEGRDVEARARDVARRIFDAYRDPVAAGPHRLEVGTSIGMAVAPRDGKTMGDLIRAADLALYEAKRSGRGQMCAFRPEIGERDDESRALQADLMNAMNSEQLEIHYQPLIDVKTRATIGYEALLRWRRPDGRLIMPDDFIPLAERCGLIVPLGEWVIREAVRQLADFPDDVGVAVNVSPVQLRDGNLPATVMSALASCDQPGHRLELEITENVVLEDSSAVRASLETLQKMGVRLALDDFGTGYASLNYLRQFRFDKVKIDRSFISEFTSRKESLAVLRATIDLASNLGITTLAEGVESEEQMEQLAREGCRQAQGFLFSAAKPIGEFTGVPGQTGSGLAAAPHALAPEATESAAVPEGKVIVKKLRASP